MKRIIAFLVTVCLLLTAIAVLAEESIGISFPEDQFTVSVGKTITLKPVITPKKSLKLEWVSSDEAVATVSAKGVVKGLAAGETVISVKAADDEGITASCKVEVVVPVKKIAFAGKKLELAAGLSQKPEVSIEPEDATNKSLSFTSSNEKVATVDENGMITAVGKGSAKITAAAQDGSKAKGSISIKVDEYDLIFTDKKPQKAVYYYDSGRYMITGKVKTGCVSIPEINTLMFAMVAGGPASEEFEVTPVKPGTDTITVKAGRLKTVIKVYVSPDCFAEKEEESGKAGT